MKKLSTQEVKKIQIEILKEVIFFCTDNNIEYFITGGTLLGAVRHAGYIPWDDDIDLIMPRKDYDRFIRTFNTNRTDRFKVLSIEQDKLFPCAFAKAVDTSTVFEENAFNYPMSVSIDIFPLDNLTGDMKRVLAVYYKILLYQIIFRIKKADLSKKRKPYENLILKILKTLLSKIEYYKIIDIIDKTAKKYAGEETGRYVGVMSLLEYRKGEILEKDIFSKSVHLTFEGIAVKAPIGYDKYLKSLYGNYMEFPPLEKQVPHHNFDAWQK